MPDKSLAHHQRSLERAFEWAGFAFKQGVSLLESAKRNLANEQTLEHLLASWCMSGSRSEDWRFVWLDVDWYFTPPKESSDAAMFLGLSYASEDRVGSHLVAGVAEVEPGVSALMTNTSQSGHWLVDYAVNPHWYPEKFSQREGPPGLVQAFPEAIEPRVGEGIKRVTWGAVPVAWINEQARLSELLEAALGLYNTRGDDTTFGEVCKRATAEVGD